MLSVKDKIQVCSKSLKCISKSPLAVGSSENFIFSLEPKVDVSTGSPVNSCASFKNGLVFGLADGRLGIFNNNIANYYNLHSSNICSVDYKDGILTTASWDNTINILEEVSKENSELSIGEYYFKKKSFKLNETVWKIKVVNKNVFATAGTGQKIVLYKNYKIFKEICNHAHVIRDFYVVENDIYSVDNYGKVLKTTVSGDIVRSRNLDEMCFCMCFFDKNIVIGGDNGSIFVLDTNLECIYKITLPCTTVWDVKADEEFVYCAGSDGVLYKLYKGADAYCLGNSDVKVEVDHEGKSPNKKVKSLQEGYFVSEGVEYKSKDGQLYKRVGNDWEIVGTAFANKERDNSFTVELSGKNYTLTFDNDENVHEVAERFLRENKIDKSHHQEIVDFINKNFKKNTLYSYYSLIDIDGIAKTIGNHPIVSLIKEVVDGKKFTLLREDANSVNKIENLLSDSEIPLFVRLDISKYLVYKKIPIDLSFLYKVDIQNKKEAKAFVFLLTNMVEDPMFNLNPLYDKTRQLRDLGLISLDDIVKLNNNRKVKEKK